MNKIQLYKKLDKQIKDVSEEPDGMTFVIEDNDWLELYMTLSDNLKKDYALFGMPRTQTGGYRCIEYKGLPMVSMTEFNSRKHG